VKQKIKQSYKDKSDGAKFVQITTLDHWHINEMGNSFLFIETESTEVSNLRTMSEQVSVPMNTKEDVDQFIKALKKIRKKLK